jgi:hypothetical protein
MPAFFPEPLPDELFYSLVARYAQTSGLSAASVRKDLFGNIRQRLSDLPSNLVRFLASLPPGHPISFRRLAEEHTSLPYFRPFLSRPQLRQVLLMMRGTGRGPAGRMPGTRTLVPPLTLQWCRECIRTDTDHHGTAYWHRVHQLPGVLVCPTHHTHLTASSVPRWSNRSSQSVEAVTLIAALERPSSTVEHPSKHTELVAGIAADSVWLLTHRLGPRDRSSLSKRLNAFAAGAGWARKSADPQAQSAGILAAIEKEIGEECLRVLGAPLRPVGPGSDWVLRAFQTIRSDPPPLHYIILLRFFGLSISDFFTGRPSPRAPNTRRVTLSAPCGNHYCERYDPPVPRTLSGPEVGDATLVRVSCPDCGFTYGQRAAQPAFRKVLRMGPLFEARARKLLSDPKKSLVTIAANLRVNRNTVKRLAKTLGLWRKSWANFHQYGRSAPYSTRLQRKRDEAKARFLALRRTHPGASRMELRALDPATTNFLRKKEPEWWAANAPPPAGPAGYRVDWAARDDEMIAAVEEAVTRLHGDPGQPKRVTLHAIGTVLGTSGAEVRRRLEQMPKARKLVRSVLETALDAGRRRLRWATRRYAEEGTVPFTHDLKRRAGIVKLLELEADVDQALDALEVHVEKGEPLPPEFAS